MHSSGDRAWRDGQCAVIVQYCTHLCNTHRRLHRLLAFGRMSAFIPPFDFRSTALQFRYHPQDQHPLLDRLSRSERDFLYHAGKNRQVGQAILLEWRIYVGTGTLDPALLAEYRARFGHTDRILLTVACEPLCEEDEALDWCDFLLPEQEAKLARLETEFAWRLERHWLVEWMDDQEAERPPVLLSTLSSTIILGATLPPKLRPALAGLSAFLVVTADELRAALTFLGGPELTASEVSRVLSYGEKVGLLVPAPPAFSVPYWQARGRSDRRPLRTYVSAAAGLARRYTPFFEAELPRPIAEVSPLWELDRTGRPTGDAADHLNQWKTSAEALRQRGTRTV